MLGGSIRRHPQELEKQPMTIKLPLESASTRPGYPTSSFGRNLLTSGTVFVHGLGVLVTLRSPGIRERNRRDSSPRDGGYVGVRRQAGLRPGGLPALLRVLVVRSDISGVLGRPGFRLEAGRSALLAATGGLRSPARPKANRGTGTAVASPPDSALRNDLPPPLPRPCAAQSRSRGSVTLGRA